MLYHLFFPLKEYYSPLNIFQYISFRSGGAIITAIILSYLFTPVLIKYFRERNISQEIRSDGPKSHINKKYIPTMGGVSILLSMVVSTLLWARINNRYILMVLGAVIFLGIVGFLDDYLKWVKKNSKGLPAKYKFLIQCLLAFAIALFLYHMPSNISHANDINIPYFKELYINLGAFYLLFMMLVIVGSSNAVNLTDGLDGLAIGNLIIAALTYSVIAYLAGHVKFSSYLRIIPIAGAGELSVFLATMVGAGLGFLWYNSYPAEVFMGDTGSLFLGGAIGVVAVIIKQELLLIIVGGVFVLEVISVILQVGSFKLRRKRIFKMAPLHHHFELCGLSEPKITIRFWIIGIILALLALSSLKVR
ncbi:MAG: phospho-N-acetylmuramoyl-pentapeptide-transferase [bacterium]